LAFSKACPNFDIRSPLANSSFGKPITNKGTVLLISNLFKLELKTSMIIIKHGINTDY
jgi:hypothetical protein